VTSLDEVLDASLASRRFSANLVVGFAGGALLLASIGIYGLLAYMVGQRSREIALRLALGAQQADILRVVLGKGVVLAGLGIVTGVITPVTIPRPARTTPFPRTTRKISACWAPNASRRAISRDLWPTM